MNVFDFSLVLIPGQGHVDRVMETEGEEESCLHLFYFIYINSTIIPFKEHE